MIFRKKIMDQNQLIDQLFGKKLIFLIFRPFWPIWRSVLKYLRTGGYRAWFPEKIGTKSFFITRVFFAKNWFLHPLSVLTHFSYDDRTFHAEFKYHVKLIITRVFIVKNVNLNIENVPKPNLKIISLIFLFNQKLIFTLCCISLYSFLKLAGRNSIWFFAVNVLEDELTVLFKSSSFSYSSFWFKVLLGRR